MKRLILIGGAMGVGKTAVSQELLRRLPEAVWLDGDWCWRMDPFRVTEARKRMALDNIAHLLGGFLDDESYENVIFCWVMDRQGIIDAVLAPLAGKEFELFSFSLVCGPGTLESRLRRDVDAGLRAPDVIGRSLERLPLYSALDTEKIGTEGLSAAGAAQEIARRVAGE